MTQSIPAQPKATSDKAARHQRLLGLVEAEDAANGELGCGQDLGKGLSGYLITRGVILDDEQLKSLLQEHLGHILTEPDFDSIATQIQRRSESLVIPAASQSLGSEPPPASTTVTAYVPIEALKELFQSQLAEFCSEAALEQLIQFSHQIIHKAILRPRHIRSSPIWILRSEA
ncbi:hypothetical protein HJG54_28115 [Leptolyngbya sp. NK1-12]|uniref:Uncharacterized protein n=1 Tax=Leptolyngbya sp. NK1-12 TaxID=2547451 RepID=A0AA97ADY9_9CYAN|nr:hypothetical protein [Leptolyngbya sp. NK1-12]WNZ21405.1 hypothetical protein HJG54_28115 [Leptolyngbya sp. NK1-12]